MFAAPSPCANAAYYDTGLGLWQGSFDFTVTAWKQLWSSGIGIKNQFFVVSMFVVTRILDGAGFGLASPGSPKSAAWQWLAMKSA